MSLTQQNDPTWLTPYERVQYGLPVPAEALYTDELRNEIEAEIREDIERGMGGYTIEDISAFSYFEGKDEAVNNMVDGYLSAMGLEEYIGDYR